MFKMMISLPCPTKLLPPPPSLEPPHLPSFPPKATQFSMRRDHSLGGSVSRLDRIRARHQDLPRQMESFAELEEEGGGEGEIGGAAVCYCLLFCCFCFALLGVWFV